MTPLPQAFYERPTVEVARSLLGVYLVHESQEGTTMGRIVETEAYLHNDPGSHSYKGVTPRTQVMFGEPGHAYIYQIYGMHFCFNIVTGGPGIGEGVLIRALEPIEGISLMRKRRGKHLDALCSGPAKLVQAMGITLQQKGHSLVKPPLYCTVGRPHKDEIITTTRIGLRLGAEAPLRFYLANNLHVSKL